MSLFECILIALRSLSQNKVRSCLTLLGVVIGVMSVIMLISLGEGAQAYVQKEFAGMGSNVLVITPGKAETAGVVPIATSAYRKLTHKNAKTIKRRATGIKGVAPMVMAPGNVRFGELQRDTTIVGVTPDFEEVRQLYTQIGRFVTEQDIEKNNKVCILGTLVKHELFGDKPALNERVSIHGSKHMVVGIMEEKGMSLGINLDDLVFIPLPSSQQIFFGGEDELWEILVAAKSPEDIKPATESIRSLLIEEHDYHEDFTITDQDSMLGTFSKIFDALRFMLVGIAAISLLVGGIGIMNIMLVSVRERTREVGIRKAVGAKRKDIAMQFLIESVTLSIIGGMIGVFLAWIGTLGMGSYYPSLPISLSLWSVMTAFLYSLAVGVFFGVYPAIKASGVDPVEALRYE